MLYEVITSKFFIDRPVLSNVLAIVMMLLGAVSLYTLPVAQYPEITPPTVQVSASFPGASPEVLAETVAAPIEQQVNGVEKMLYMSSNSTANGNFSISVTFEIGTDLDIAQVQVQNRVNIALPRLPASVRQTGVTVEKRSSDLMLVVHIFSPDQSSYNFV